MVKTTVYLDPHTALALRQMAEQQKRSQAELIREALREYSDRGGRARLPGVGGHRSGRSDVSGRTRELLRRAVRQRRWPS